jgi:hypothetical protein
VIIYLTLTIPMIIWVMTSFFSSLPRTVEAAARVDGNTRWQAFYRVILPMSWPGIAVERVRLFPVPRRGLGGADAASGHLDLLLPDLATDRNGRRLDHRHHSTGHPRVSLPKPHPQSQPGRSAIGRCE